MRPPESASAHAVDAAALHASALQLGLEPSARQLDQLQAFAALLQRWNATYNLTAVRNAQGILVQHLLDCLAVVAPMRRALPHGGRVLDVGSGGGLPGVVLAVMLDDVDVTCVDAVGKKAAFVRQVSGALGLPKLQAVHARVEQLQCEPFDVITSRAFASLADFTHWTRPLLAAAGVWVAMKGQGPTEEVQALPGTVEVFHVEPLRVPGLDAQRCLVWMRDRTSA